VITAHLNRLRGKKATVRVVSCSAAVQQYGTQLGGTCDDPHINRITYELAGTCNANVRIKIWSSAFGEEGDEACSIGGGQTYDSFQPASTVTSAGAGVSVTYWVRVYESGVLIHQRACAAITFNDDGACL
jgi:hypothetical protein